MDGVQVDGARVGRPQMSGRLTATKNTIQTQINRAPLLKVNTLKSQHRTSREDIQRVSPGSRVGATTTGIQEGGHHMEVVKGTQVDMSTPTQKTKF